MGVKLLDGVLDATPHEFVCEFELSDLCGDLFVILMLPCCPFLGVVVNDGLLEDPVIILHCDDVGSAPLAEGGSLQLLYLL
jgi:hypothetical protein